MRDSAGGKTALPDFTRVRTNLGKIRCWGAGEASPPPGIAELGNEVWRGDLSIEKQGLIMLGSPIGSVEFAAKWCEHTATRQNRFLNQLGRIREAQSRWLLLKFCVEPTCNHILRNVPLHMCHFIADWPDNAIWRSLLALFDLNPALVGDVSWFVASSPIRLGGLGLRSCTRLAAAIHWAAWADSFENLHKRFPVLAARITTALNEGSNAPSLQYVRENVLG